MSLLWPQYYDPALPLTPKQVRQVRKRAWELWRKRRSNYLLYTAITFGASLAMQAWVRWIISGRTSVLTWYAIASFLLVVAVPSLAIVMLQRSRFGPQVRGAVREIGYEVCEKCGYWLRGLDRDVTKCPECGSRRQPMPLGAPRLDAPAIAESPPTRTVQDLVAELRAIGLDVCPHCGAAIMSRTTEATICAACGRNLPTITDQP